MKSMLMFLSVILGAIVGKLKGEREDGAERDSQGL